MTIIFLVLGLIFGSFINSFVWRLHLKYSSSKKVSKKHSFFKGRSMCPKCKHILSPVDLFPIFSWLLLRGKCRYCHKAISLQYPIVELITGVLFSLSYFYWPYSFNLWDYILLMLWLVILVILVGLAIYDFKYKILPNNLVYSAIFLSLVFATIYYIKYDQTSAYLLARLYGVLFSAGIFYLIFQVSNGKWIGGGDVKLCIALGIILGGPLEVVLMLFLASLAGSLMSGFLLITKKLKANMTIAFGPLLIFSTFLCFFFGSQILNWYTGLIG